MDFYIVTLFPEMLEGLLGASMMRRATDMNAARFHFVNPRDFTTDKHQTTDDRPFGGGPGMVMKPEPLAAASESVRTDAHRVILLSPQGTPFKQSRAEELAAAGAPIIFVCGHYEGVDQRFIDRYVDEEISIGDYVLTNGALAASVVIDAVVRLLPGVVGGEGGIEQESFSSGLLDFPQYTRPQEWEGEGIPDVLLRGNHAAIDAWRQEVALQRTRDRRPDLL